MTELVRKDSIQELCGHRERALNLYAKAYAMLADARAAHARACIGNSSISNLPHEMFRWFTPDEQGKFADTMRRSVDQDMWTAFMVNTPLGSLMDRKEKEKFESDVKQDPPEITPDTVFATMARLAGEAPIIFRRGLVNAFADLCRDYKSHDGFKIGDRIIITYSLSVNNFVYLSAHLSQYKEPVLRDVDRVMHVLDGKPAPDYQQGLCAAIREALHSRPIVWEVKTPYWRIKMFKNGNAHLYPLWRDLVEKANKLIAEHYGATVGAAPDVATKRYEANPEARREPDFFPTPEDVARQMVDAANLRDGESVLEPEAGEGHIASAIKAAADVSLTCVERDAGRAEILREKLGQDDQLVHGDFLTFNPSRRFNAILMNPPYSHGQAPIHFMHALGLLAPGGRLVAIMPRGITFRRDAPYAECRDMIEAMGGTIEDLPSGSFKDSGTMVETVMVTVTAQPAAAANEDLFATAAE